MAHQVAELVVEERPTAVVAETTTWAAFPELWPRLLDEVWSTVRSSSGVSPGRNVMLYLDDCSRVEVGVEVAEPFAGAGRVVGSTLPAGRVAVTTHRSGYATLGAAHEAVIEECDRRGLRRLGPRWEVYGHQTEAPGDPEVEVFYLVERERPAEAGLSTNREAKSN